jgi:hypothetical protein
MRQREPEQAEERGAVRRELFRDRRRADLPGDVEVVQDRDHGFEPVHPFAARAAGDDGARGGDLGGEAVEKARLPAADGPLEERDSGPRTRRSGGASLLVAGAANAQDVGRDYFRQQGDRAAEGETVALRLTLPFGGEAKDKDAAPRLALSFSRTDAEGAMRGMDLASYRLDGGPGRIETPFRAYAGESSGGWIAAHPVLFTIGAGLIIWGVVEATQDDEDDTPPAPPQQNT